MSQQQQFFDGTPAKARARINPYRDEMYDTSGDTPAEQPRVSSETVELPPELNPSSVQ